MAASPSVACRLCFGGGGWGGAPVADGADWGVGGLCLHRGHGVADSAGGGDVPGFWVTAFAVDVSRAGDADTGVWV